MGLRRVLALAESSGEPSAGQRAPRDDAHPVLLGDRQHVGLDAADEDRIRRLLGDEATESVALGDPLILDDSVRRKGRRAEGADLALPLEVGERGDGLVVVGAGVGSVHLVEVDPVGLQTFEAVFDLLDDPAARVASLVRVAGLAEGDVHRTVELGGEDDVVAPAPGQGLADDDLGFAL